MQQHADRPDSGGPQAVDLALSLLELISQSSQGMRLTDAAQVLKVSKTRAYRLLSVLAERGYVRQEPISKRYFVGPMSLTLASVASGGFQLRDVAREYLERLNRDTGETVHLAVYSHGEVIYIDKLDTVHAVGPKSDIGTKAPAFCVSTGRALLAFQPQEEVESILKSGLPRFTPETVTDPTIIQEMLEQVRRKGYAVNRGSWREGVCGVAAPIRDRTGLVIASVGCCVPESRFSRRAQRSLTAAVTAAGQDISSQLGFHPILKEVSD